MKDKLKVALNEISEKKIAEAAGHRKKRGKLLLRIAAAAAVIALFISLASLPMAIPAQAISLASDSRLGTRPDPGSDDFRAWANAREDVTETAESAVSALTPFFQKSASAYMSGAQDNRVWSPANGYIALAALAEITEGDSRQQILQLLGTRDLDTLRTQVSGIWESVYRDDGNEICVLANSLWLDDSLTYSQSAMDALARYHYASVYQADLQGSRASKALAAWLSNNTGGLLRNHTDGAHFQENAVFTLASTVYLQSKWGDEFSPKRNTQDVFHAPSGERSVTFMNKKEYQTTYYWGDSFGAVALSLKNGTRMWFFLPDPGKTVDDVLSDGQYLRCIAARDQEDFSKYMKVNLSVPKFDISSSANLTQMLQSLGVTGIFDAATSNFTALIGDTPVFVAGVNQAARVIIDEQGVKAASYIEIPGVGAAMPPEEIIDFILDRPFLFVIASYEGVPLFTGVVNEP